VCTRVMCRKTFTSRSYGIPHWCRLPIYVGKQPKLHGDAPLCLGKPRSRWEVCPKGWGLPGEPRRENGILIRLHLESEIDRARRITTNTVMSRYLRAVSRRKPSLGCETWLVPYQDRGTSWFQALGRTSRNMSHAGSQVTPYASDVIFSLR
jgi:hypothetical protein